MTHRDSDSGSAIGSNKYLPHSELIPPHYKAPNIVNNRNICFAK